MPVVPTPLGLEEAAELTRTGDLWLLRGRTTSR